MKKHLLQILLFSGLFFTVVRAQNIYTSAGTGTYGYSGDGGASISAQISIAMGVATDASGNIYFTDHVNHCVRKISPSGIITTAAGTGTAGFSGDGGLATSAELNLPCGIAIDNSGNLYIGDFGNFRIRKVSSTGIITTIAGTGNYGYTGDGGPATSANLAGMSALAIDNAGNLFVADDQEFVVRKISPSGTITTVAGTGTNGFSGDGGPATMADISNPISLALDASGNLFISDRSNRRIRKVNSSGIISTYAGNGFFYSGDGGPATSAGIGQPVALTCDASGNLYFSADYTGRIRKISTTGTITTFAGSGTVGYSGDGGPALMADIGSCSRGMAFDASNNLYFGDSASFRIRVICQSSCVNGIKETQRKGKISVYPNPNNGQFFIEAAESDVLYITNQLGQQIITVELNEANNYTSEINNLAPGFYFVTGKNYKAKVVVSK